MTSSDAQGPAAVITGYAATFDQADAQSDVVAAGAFGASLARRRGRVPLLWQHQVDEPIGHFRALREDARGLWFQAELAGSRRARDALDLIRRGALRECSIGFLPRRVRLQTRGGRRVRLVQEVELIEVSLVTLAANPHARLLTLDGAPLDAGLVEPAQRTVVPFVASPAASAAG